VRAKSNVNVNTIIHIYVLYDVNVVSSHIGQIEMTKYRVYYGIFIKRV
jgi:hypothetical protein